MDHGVLTTPSDRYVIVEPLAEGGMGSIFLGKRLAPSGADTPVVLKQLLPEHTHDRKLIDLFLREAEVTATLDHPNIVRMLDLVSAGSDYFIVMEYVRGGNLQTMLKRARRRHQFFSVESAIFIGIEIVRALGYAHGRRSEDGRPLGVVHRDVTPSNILVSDTGQVKLTDFGIAKAPDQHSVVFKVKGKVGYMAPEQARGAIVDARSDLFSLGVVLYEVLAGERLFVGDLLSTVSMIYSQPVVPPSRKRSPGEIPPELDALILRALSLDPKGRFQSAAELEAALTDLAKKYAIPLGAGGAVRLSEQLREACGLNVATWQRLDEAVSEVITHGATSITGKLDLEEEETLNTFDRPARTVPLPEGELTSVIKMRLRAPLGLAEFRPEYRDDPSLQLNAPIPKPMPAKLDEQEDRHDRTEEFIRSDWEQATEIAQARKTAAPADQVEHQSWDAPTTLSASARHRLKGRRYDATYRGQAFSSIWVRIGVGLAAAVILLAAGIAIGLYFSGPSLP